MAFGSVELLLIFLLINGVLMAWSVADILKRPAPQWRAVGESRLAWLCVAILGGGLGAIAYMIVVRLKFTRLPIQPY